MCCLHISAAATLTVQKLNSHLSTVHSSLKMVTLPSVSLGGLQLWDTRKKSCRQSDLKWGLTGAPQDIGKVSHQDLSIWHSGHITQLLQVFIYALCKSTEHLSCRFAFARD